MYLIIPRKVYIIICLHNAYYLKGLLPNFLAMVFEQVFFLWQLRYSYTITTKV